MRNAKRGLLVAAVVLAASFLPAASPRSVAQVVVPPVPGLYDEAIHPPWARSQADYADYTSGGAADSGLSGLALTRRLAQLARGRTQLEGGYSWLHDSANGESINQHAFPDLLLRFGLTNRLELRVGWPGYVASDFDDPALGEENDGVLDPNVGLAYDLWCQRGLLPQTAVLAAVPVPLEGNPFALRSLQPLTELMYAWSAGDRAVITGRSGFALRESQGDNYTQFQQGLSLDIFLTDRLAAFALWDMLANRGWRNETSQHMAGGGLSLLLTERLALSWRAAVGLNAAAPDFVNDIRFAYRF